MIMSSETARTINRVTPRAEAIFVPESDVCSVFFVVPIEVEKSEKRIKEWKGKKAHIIYTR